MESNDTEEVDLLAFVPLDNNTQHTAATYRTNPMDGIPEYHIAMAIVTYGFPLVVGCGTIGNLLSFLVLIRKRMRNTSVYFYLAILAVTDTCVLYSSAFRTWIRVTTDFELLHVSWVGCKTLMFIFMVSTHSSAWLVVAMTTDRFIVIWCPLRANRLCDIRRARIITAILFIAICLYKLHLFWTIDLLHVRGRMKCASQSHFMMNTYPLLKLASYTIVPFIIVIILNVLITCKLWQSRKAFQQDSLRRSTESSADKMAQYRITVMLLTVSFVWLTLTAPFTARSLMDSQKITPKDMNERARNLLIRTVCFLLMYTNHGINFLLYCLTGNKFRSELADTLCFQKCRGCTQRSRTHYRDMSLQTTKIVLKRTNSPWDSNMV